MRNGRFFFVTSVAALVLTGWLGVATSHAISLNFVPSNQAVLPGTPVTVDVEVSGLSAAAEIVSAFDLDVLYDSTILTATDVTFGPLLGDPSFEALTEFLFPSPGVVDFAELSFLPDSDLAALQGDTVFLAQLSFDTLGVGSSSLAFVLDTFNDVKGRNGIILDLFPGSGSVDVVPEPATLVLMGTGLIALVGWRLRKPKRISLPIKLQ